MSNVLKIQRFYCYRILGIYVCFDSRNILSESVVTVCSHKINTLTICKTSICGFGIICEISETQHIKG